VGAAFGFRAFPDDVAVRRSVSIVIVSPLRIGGIA
jgi:hypothetical protein